MNETDDYFGREREFTNMVAIVRRQLELDHDDANRLCRRIIDIPWPDPEKEKLFAEDRASAAAIRKSAKTVLGLYKRRARRPKEINQQLEKIAAPIREMYDRTVGFSLALHHGIDNQTVAIASKAGWSPILLSVPDSDKRFSVADYQELLFSGRFSSVDLYEPECLDPRTYSDTTARVGVVRLYAEAFALTSPMFRTPAHREIDDFSEEVFAVIALTYREIFNRTAARKNEHFIHFCDCLIDIFDLAGLRAQHRTRRWEERKNPFHPDYKMQKSRA